MLDGTLNNTKELQKALCDTINQIQKMLSRVENCGKSLWPLLRVGFGPVQLEFAEVDAKIQ